MTPKKTLLTALLGAAFLTLPITANARDHGPQRNFAPANRPAPAFHPAPAPRANFAPRPNFAPRVNAYNRAAIAAPPIMQVHDHDGWRWHDRDDGWRHHDRDDWGWHHHHDWRWNDHDRDDAWRNSGPYYAAPDYCQRRPFVNNYYYRQGYRPYYYQPDSYDYATPYYGGGLAALMHQRDGAQIQYQLAVQRGDRKAAKHLARDIRSLNDRIASARGRGYGYSGYSAINSPYLNNYDYGQGYGSGYDNYGPANSGLGGLVGPLLGNIY